MENFNANRFLSTRRLTMNAVFIAIYVVLDMFSVYIGNYIKLSFASFPLLVASLLFGILDGVLVAGLGEFIYQLLMYGLGPTTLLWMMPPILHALIVGLYARRYNHDLDLRHTALIILIAGLITALFTTFVIYLDGKIWGYNPGLTAIVILFRFVNALIMCAIYTLVTPKTIQLLKRVYKPRAA